MAAFGNITGQVTGLKALDNYVVDFEINKEQPSITNLKATNIR